MTIDRRRPRACFFARVKDQRQIETVEFYAQDVRCLQELGYDVRVATRVRDLIQLPADDLYFCWWWTWACFPVSLARLSMRPTIVTGTFNHHLFAGRPPHQRRLIAWAARHADANVFVSQMERDAVTRLVSGIQRPSVSPHTVDTAAYAPMTSGGPQRDPNLLLSIVHLDGGNASRKCVGSSIRAVAQLAPRWPGLRLVVAGERGSDYPELARLAEGLGIGGRVGFPGRVTREEKIRLMQTCAIYLQPSTFEGFGLAGLEAMACGAPMITSPVGAVREVGGEAVIYVNGEDPGAIGSAVESLMASESRREELGRAGRERAVRYFPLERRRRDLEAVLDSIGATR